VTQTLFDSNAPDSEVHVTLDGSYAEARKQAILNFERSYVRSLLDRTGGNVSQAARIAGIDRVYLHRLIRRHRPAMRIVEGEGVQGDVVNVEHKLGARHPGERWEALKAVWRSTGTRR